MFKLSTQKPQLNGPEEPGRPSWGLFWSQVRHILRWLVTTTDGVKVVVLFGFLFFMGITMAGFYGTGVAAQELKCEAYNTAHGIEPGYFGVK